jgi:hypothetical protein
MGQQSHVTRSVKSFGSQGVVGSAAVPVNPFRWPPENVASLPTHRVSRVLPSMVSTGVPSWGPAVVSNVSVTVPDPPDQSNGQFVHAAGAPSGFQYWSVHVPVEVCRSHASDSGAPSWSCANVASSNSPVLHTTDSLKHHVSRTPRNVPHPPPHVPASTSVPSPGPS